MYNDFDPQKQQYTRPEQNRSEYSWQGDYYQTYRPVVSSPAPAAKKKNPAKVILIILAVILSCAIVSAATLGVFITLINNGTIALQNTGTSANPAYTITKLISGTEEEPEKPNEITGTVSKLSVEEIAEKIMPSVVLIQNYQMARSNNIFCSVFRPAKRRAFSRR